MKELIKPVERQIYSVSRFKDLLQRFGMGLADEPRIGSLGFGLFAEGIDSMKVNFVPSDDG